MQQTHPQDKQPDAKVLQIIGAALAAGGFALILLMVYLHLAASATSNWPSTEGRITGSQVRRHLTGREARVWAGRDRSDDDRAAQFAPSITYQYNVAGQPLKGNRYRLGEGIPMFSTREEARAYLAETYPGGRKVTVYYNPQDPTDAVLENGTTNVFIYVALGGFFLVLTGAALVITASKVRTSQPFPHPA